MRFNKYVLLGAMIIGSLPAIANDKTDKNWNQQLRAEGIPAKDQSYCYTNELGILEGENVDMRIRLASVSKLLTSLWSVEKLGVNYKYNMKLYIKGNNLHIEGSYDPFLGNEKMFFLVSQLNELGYSKFDTITFDKNLKINPDVQYESDEYPTMNSITNGRNLKKYFNTATWTNDDKLEYSNFAYLAKAGKFRKDVHFEASTVQFVEENPLLADKTAIVLTLSSPELYKYLKEMNIKSNNNVAETIFRQLGGVSKFQQYLSERFNLTNEQIRFYTGSGLPSEIDGARVDNYSTCAITLNLISELKTLIEKQGREIEDVMAVPGSDGGTFRNRLFPADYKNAFVAKTGTLMHTSTLAGAMSTTSGFSFFGVFNQSTDISGSKRVQNSMVKSIMIELGGPKNFEYEVEGFHTYTGDTLKDFDQTSDFTTIENGLY